MEPVAPHPHWFPLAARRCATSEATTVPLWAETAKEHCQLLLLRVPMPFCAVTTTAIGESDWPVVAPFDVPTHTDSPQPASNLAMSRALLPLSAYSSVQLPPASPAPLLLLLLPPPPTAAFCCLPPAVVVVAAAAADAAGFCCCCCCYCCCDY